MDRPLLILVQSFLLMVSLPTKTMPCANNWDYLYCITSLSLFGWSSILWHICLKQELWRQKRQPLLRNGSVNPVARQWLSSCRMKAATETQQYKSCWKWCFLCSLWQGYIYNEDQLPLQNNLEAAVRRVGGSCEMAASLWGREPRSRGMSAVGRHYPVEQWRPWLRTSVFVW
jgi:hypothetical protein